MFEQMHDDVGNVLQLLPREMLSVFKHNDILHKIQESLEDRDDTNVLGDMARTSVKVVYAHKKWKCSSRWCRIRQTVREWYYLLMISLYEWYVGVCDLSFIKAIRRHMKSDMDHKYYALKDTVKILGFTDNFQGGFVDYDVLGRKI